MSEGKPIEEHIEEAYLLALSRFPSAAERKELVTVMESELAQGNERRAVLEDMLWSLMTSPESCLLTDRESTDKTFCPSISV